MENSLASTLGTLYHSGRLSLSDVIALMSHRGAEICNLNAGTLSKGAVADICLIDPNEEWTVETAEFFSRSKNCPWQGRRLKGRVKATYVSGKLVFDGTIITR